jgi:serine/threonine-protein kinase
MVDGEVTHRWPQVLPGGRAVLYTAHNDARGYDEATIAIQPLPSGTPRVILRGGYHGRYLPSGHLVYVKNGTMFAARFDLNRLEVVGDPVQVVEGISAVPRSGGAQFSVSDTGTMVYVSERAGGGLPMYWVDRDGNTSVMRATPAEWNSPQFSPDGSTLAFDITDARGQDDIWIYEWMRDTMPRRLTFDASNDRAPVWTPDGRRITYSSGRPGDFGLYWRRADGVGETQRLTQSKFSQTAGAWHPSGKVLIFTATSVETRTDLMLLPMEGDETAGWKPGTPTAFLNGPASEGQASFSPDGRWVAYSINESGRTDVWVRSFPGPGGVWQVTSDGGSEPQWSHNRKELFYRVGPRLMVASYRIDADVFRVESTREVAGIRSMPRTPGFSLHPDGNRVVAAAVSAAPQNTVVFVSNFLEELRRTVR